jgi:pimeloyl-ACP methyl ester carboxylesterase
MRDLALVPGLNNTAAVWDAVVPHLGAAARCHAFDNAAADNLDAIADDWLARLPPRFHLAGFSFGGYVALTMLAKAPERVVGMAMVCTTPFADIPAQAAAREKSIATARDGGYRTMVAAQAGAAFHPDSLTDAAMMARREAMVDVYGAERFIAHQCAALSRSDRTELLAGYDGPVLIVAATGDNAFPLKIMQRFADAMPRARFETVDRSGHLLPMEQPKALAGILSDWLGAP